LEPEIWSLNAMPVLKINGIEVSVEAGATILDAARKAGVEIPTMCWMKELKPATSCMFCVVKDLKTGQLLPACSAPATHGMEVNSDCIEVREARREVLNLLLSEHVGDCEAPCTRICPAGLDTPAMLRRIRDGNIEAAAWIARRDLAIPVILGYICPAPCEKGCRRAQIDKAIAIREMHRKAAEAFPTPGKNFPVSGKKIAVIGSGPAGLSSAWKLRQLGYACTVFDETSEPGGALLDLPEEKLPRSALRAEIETLKAAGIEFRLGATPAESDFDAVIEPEEHKLAVKAVANGKATAEELDLKFRNLKKKPRFSSRIGRLRESEVKELLKNTIEIHSDNKMQNEAARCLHCDCRKSESCKLRKYAEEYGARQDFYEARERRHVELIGRTGEVIFEPGKCIKCGICVRLTERAGEELGLTFTGRGFHVQVKVPFNESLENGLKRVARECVEACPTGALAFRNKEDH